MRSLLALSILLTSQLSMALTLEEFLAQVTDKNGLMKSLSSSSQASEARREQGDLPLAPKLTAKAHRLDDKKVTIVTFGTLVVPMNKVAGSEYTVALSKKFSTGTDAEISGSLNDIGQYSPDGTGGTTAPQVYGAVGVSITQSLWKDFFGRGIALRREREAVVEKTEKSGFDMQGRQVLIDAEAAFWDQVYLSEEIHQREQSLERARRIEGWVRNRLSNGIGDRADVLNAQGLVAVRELALLGSQDEARAAEEKVRTMLELSAAEKTPELTADLSKLRPIDKMGGSSKVVRLDAYLAVLEAKAKAVMSQETEDNMRPDLVFTGRYNTNSNDNYWSGASSRMTDTNAPTTDVVLKFTYNLDGGLKESARRMARMEALAASQKKERKLLESDSSWQEFQRRHSELTKKIQAAEKASQIQTSKAAAERDKLSKGRSITSQVITAEQDAAETTLTLTKLRAEQRKLEAQARMYVQLEAP